MNKTGIILLAAGGSSRLGRPKQLLPYGNKTLVQHALDIATESKAQTVVVVTGARTGIVSSNYSVPNDAWKEGIASSIRAGLAAILNKEPDLDAVIFIVCDQPYISAALLNELMDAHASAGKEIVASAYSGTVGIPALFGKSFFDALLQLTGDEGAKRIIMQNPESVAIVDFPKGNIDIDTEGEWSVVSGE